MKVIYLITGSGGSFYCANCYRDMLYFRAIRQVPGITANAIPLYLPPEDDSSVTGFDRHVFFGAISMFLREKAGFLKNMPAFLERFFDMTPFLKLASRQAGTTSVEGYEELTINMIEGDNAFRKNEVDRLVKYLMKGGKPDVIHLSNALILGLARQLKNRMKVKVVCSLLNEDDWIDDMAEPWQSRAWEMIGRESVYVDHFITPSNYYRQLFISKTGVKGDNIHVIPLGFDPEPPYGERNTNRPPALGYFSRISQHNGFDKLTDAFIELKTKYSMHDLGFHVCGGYTGIDKAFISDQIRKIRDHGFQKSIRIYPEFQGNKKMEFFNNVDVISVPVRKYDGYGLYILEANSSGIPVVQPATGAFPEIIATTGGGITYQPDTVEELSSSLHRLLTDRELAAKLGQTGKERVLTKLSIEKMSAGMYEVYK
ncbi:MAG TPA: glycosyltransferase family 4 protein [Bacteroidales bacterium]|jgi:glycosyltransferase involved in cell wall biosynthesis|nr:glycosyltransferase family 4 protein [Bacteroidales bacterium]HQH23348.1 glycosyltransferase family 4 protein [Bacteroidales bacterium]HQJ81407.1 glycosyltransferase family 4 protein [Bacteroidales bacterium]